MDIPDYEDPERLEALSRLLQFIEVSLQDFDANAAAICEIAAEAKRTQGRALGVFTNGGRTLRFPDAIGPLATAEAYEQPAARRYVMAWAVRETLLGAQVALISFAPRAARPLDCEVLSAARACLAARAAV